VLVEGPRIEKPTIGRQVCRIQRSALHFAKNGLVLVEGQDSAREVRANPVLVVEQVEQAFEIVRLVEHGGGGQQVGKRRLQILHTLVGEGVEVLQLLRLVADDAPKDAKAAMLCHVENVRVEDLDSHSHLRISCRK